MRVASRTVFDFVRPGGNTAPVETELLYETDDPFAVTMRFHSGGAVATWIMGRDLLIEGMTTPSGRGDVRLRPHSSRTLVLELISDRHFTVFRLPAGTLRKFLDATYRLVPPGAEHFDADAFLDTVLR
jgi:Streptomyces sporulation and cell division protein, SsgA